MSNKKILCNIGITFTILVIAVVVLCNLNFIKTRFYFGDRITGTFSMTVDGKEYDPIEEMLEYENEGTQRLTTSISGFSIKGGSYGSYKIGFLLDNKELYKLTGDEKFNLYTTNSLLTFQYINTNWWHITKMTLTAEMSLVDGEWIISTKVVYSEPLENGEVSESTVEKVFKYDEIISGNGVVPFGV